MLSMHIKYENKTKFYCYNDKGISVEPTEEEINKIINILNTRKITNVHDYKESLSVILEEKLEVIIDNPGVVKDLKLQPFIKKIKAFEEKQKLNDLKKSYPDGYIPRVNRSKSKQIEKRLISVSLAAAIFMGVLPMVDRAILKEKNKSKTDDIVNEIVVDMPKESSGTNDTYYNISYIAETPEEVNRTTVDLAIAYKGDGKYESTVDYCGDIVAYYCTRYGLPYDTVIRQLTQERPNIDENGNCDNPFQISKDLFLGKYNNGVAQRFHIPVYNEEGTIISYDDFVCTKELLDSLEGNIQVGCAYLRHCTDLYDSLILGLVLYNQGESSLYNACHYYGLKTSDYMGDENAIAARDLIVSYLKDINRIQGDFDYLEHVFGNGPEDRSALEIEYSLGNEKKAVTINNTLDYSMTSDRG